MLFIALKEKFSKSFFFKEEDNLVNLRLYYKFLYIPSGMLYDDVGMKGMAQKRKEEFRMDRYTVTMRHEHLEFLLCSFKQELCFALRCPEMMHGKELKQTGE